MKLRQPPRWGATDTLLHLAAHDTLVQVGLLVAVAGIALPVAAAGAGGHPAFLVRVLPRIALAIVVVVALGRGLDHLQGPDERAFWDDLLLAAGIFAAGLIVQVTGPWTGVERAMLAGRLLFTVSFAQLLLTVERRPDRPGPWRPRRMERRLALQAVAVLTVGLVVYFAVLPRAAVDPEVSTRAAARVFSVFGLLLLLRLVHLGATAPDPRWRLLYRVLTVTAAGLCLFYLRRLPPLDRLAAPWPAPVVAITWTVPLLAVLIAARLRHLPFPATWTPSPRRGDGDEPDDPIDEIRAGLGSRTLILALAVPSMHYIGYLLGLFDPDYRWPREQWMVAWTLALGVVVLLQRQQLEGRLRRALDDQDRIERTLRASERRLKLSDVRREADEILFASREKYAKAFRSSPFGLVITTHAEARHVDCNDRYLEILGRHRHEVIGRTVPELGLFADAETLERFRATLRDRGRVERQIATLRRPDGSRRRLRLSAERLALGDEPCDLSVVEDLTSEDGARGDLRRRAGWLDAADAVVVGIDSDGAVALWNPHAVELTAIDADDALGRPLAEVLPVESPDLDATACHHGVEAVRLAEGRQPRLECFWSRVEPEIDGEGGGTLLVAREVASRPT